MSEQPNGLENTTQTEREVTAGDFIVTSYFFTPTVVTRLGEEGTDSRRMYVMELHADHVMTGEHVALNFSLDEDMRDRFILALSQEHFPDQPCNHKEVTPSD